MQLKPLFVQIIIQVSGGKEKERQGWEEDLVSFEVWILKNMWRQGIIMGYMTGYECKTLAWTGI